MEEKVDLEALYQEAVNDFTDVNTGVLLLILAELREANKILKCQK